MHASAAAAPRKLPDEIRWRLAQLDLELSEGEITEKGYEKKRRILLAPYLGNSSKCATTSTTCLKDDLRDARSKRRLTRHESRYHSEVRHEAVQHALAKFGDGANGLRRRSSKGGPRGGESSMDPKHAIGKDKAGTSDSSTSSADEQENIADGGNGELPESRVPCAALLQIMVADEHQSKVAPSSQPKSIPVNGNTEAIGNGTSSANLVAARQPLRRPIGATHRRLSPAIKRTSVLILEDKPLPDLPLGASDDEVDALEEEDAEETANAGVVDADAVYVNSRVPLSHSNTRTSTNDSGIGCSSSAPQDYANTKTPFKPAKVSQKILQILLSLQAIDPTAVARLVDVGQGKTVMYMIMENSLPQQKRSGAMWGHQVNASSRPHAHQLHGHQRKPRVDFSQHLPTPNPVEQSLVTNSPPLQPCTTRTSKGIIGSRFRHIVRVAPDKCTTTVHPTTKERDAGNIQQKVEVEDDFLSRQQLKLSERKRAATSADKCEKLDENRLNDDGDDSAWLLTRSLIPQSAAPPSNESLERREHVRPSIKRLANAHSHLRLNDDAQPRSDWPDTGHTIDASSILHSSINSIPPTKEYPWEENWGLIDRGDDLLVRSKSLAREIAESTIKQYPLQRSATNVSTPARINLPTRGSKHSSSRKNGKVKLRHAQTSSNLYHSGVALEQHNPRMSPAREDRARREASVGSDPTGFGTIQQILKDFTHVKELRIGHNRYLRIADLPLKEFESIRCSQIMKRYKRPRHKALHEFYNDDDDAELEAMAKAADPNAPKPEGQLMSPVRGDYCPTSPPATPSSRQTIRSIDSILHRHGTTQPKAIAASVLDATGRIGDSLSYGKLLSRATKVAYMLLSKQVTIHTASGKEKVHLCLPGDRVALVYPNTEPLAFLTAFYGCLLAGVVPVPIEVPLGSKRNEGTVKQFGFLLGSCDVHVALTSETCLKGLPKAAKMTSSANRAGTHDGNQLNGNAISPSSTNAFPTSTTSSGGSGGSGSIHFPSNAHHGGSSSGLAHSSDGVAEFKGWPRIHWVVTEHLAKSSRDWTLPSTAANEELAYVEYTVDREGCVKGVCVSRQAMLSHCRALTTVMAYREGETCVSMLDFKRDAGLWHGILAAVYAGMHVAFVPYTVMKQNPSLWLIHATKLRASRALLRSRDLHWSLLAQQVEATRDPRELQLIQLSSLRSIVVADGSNPWSLSSCDQFSNGFQSLGLDPNALCPCAGSPETGSISIRRLAPGDQIGEASATRERSTEQTPSTPASDCCNSGRGVLSMVALSHLTVRVDQEDSLTSLALQDAGKVIPGGIAVVVKMTGPPKLCRTDEIGEICLHAASVGSGYFGLAGLSKQAFNINPLTQEGREFGPMNYTRSGLIGFLGPKGLVFIIGNKTSMLHISGRHHSADDVIATSLAVEPTKAIYRGRIAAFGVSVLRDERLCIVAEQKADLSEEDAFNWMVRVIQAIDSIHQVGVYCLAMVAANQLPRTPLGGLQVPEIRRRFVDGSLRPTIVLMCPQNSILNLPHPREAQSSEIGPAAMFVGNLVQGARIACAQGREMPSANQDTEPFSLVEILRQRAHHSPDHVLFTLMKARGAEAEQLTSQQLVKRAERVGALLLEKGHLSTGDHVALIFPPGLELIVAFYGCLMARLVPTCIRAPSPTNLRSSLVTVKMIVDVCKAVAVLSNASLIKLLRSKEANHRVNMKAWPTILDIDDAPSSSVARRRNVFSAEQALLRPNDTLYLDFSVSSMGQLSGVVVSDYSDYVHIEKKYNNCLAPFQMSALSASQECRSLKAACELYPSRSVLLSLDPYSGLGFVLWCLSSVYSGHQSILIPPSEVELNASVWFSALSQHKIRDSFCSYSVMEICVKELGPQVPQLKERGISLAGLRTCIAVAEERPRFQLCTAFTRLFAPLGLASRAVSTSFGSRVNSAVCMQGSASPDPLTLYVDAGSLRHDRIRLVQRGSPHSIALMDSGKILPGVRVVIANPDTKGQCADSHLGEIWVASEHNAIGYFSLFGEEAAVHTDHFNARLRTGDTKSVFARTGYLGFLRSISQAGELHDALFVVGSLDEALWLRGMRYHPCDIENTVCKAHLRICESAVFVWTHLLVVVAETTAAEVEDALDLVPAITSVVLEEHHLIVGVVVLVDLGVIPVNSRGEKQRAHLKDSFIRDQLDPIYVAYNM